MRQGLCNRGGGHSTGIRVGSRKTYRQILCFMMLLAGLLIELEGCAKGNLGTGTVHYVEILDHISPRELYVKTGDEVRWLNLRTAPVRVGLLAQGTVKHVICGEGFSHYGVSDDHATIEPQRFASLCFDRPGVVRYNVWLDPDNPRGFISPTATIRVNDSAR